MCLLNPLYNTTTVTEDQNTTAITVSITLTTLSLILLLPFMFIFSLSLEQKPGGLEWLLRTSTGLAGVCQDFTRKRKANNIAHLVNVYLRGRRRRVNSYTVVYTKR